MNLTQITSTMPLRRDYHVLPHAGIWELKREYTAASHGFYITQEEAIGAAISQAREGLVSFYVHGRNGVIQWGRSYDDARWPD